MNSRIFKRTPPAELIFLARDVLGLTSDDALASRMGVSSSQFSGWKKGRLDMPDHRVLELAKLAGADPAVWLVVIAADRAKHSDVRETWREVARRIASKMEDAYGSED